MIREEIGDVLDEGQVRVLKTDEHARRDCECGCSERDVRIVASGINYSAYPCGKEVRDGRYVGMHVGKFHPIS